MDGETGKTEQSNTRAETASSPSDYAEDIFRNCSQVMELFREGEGKIQLKKRFMLKMLDESWVKIIEDTIPSLDVIIRRPGRFLEEKEELRPIEQIRKVSPRSIQHLSQHTDLINDIRSDGSVTPSKLLNVFQDETILTYENRFINTLISRLYAFVCVRVDAAEECGVDEKLSTLSFDQSFTDGEKRGKIALTIELSETPRENEVVKNYVYTSDLWKRALRLRRLVSSYTSSDFVQQMGRNYVRPPVMRTNMLLKNVDFRQCLTLWEFLESYENAGYESLIQEELDSVTDECARDFYKSLAEQYVLFEKHVKNCFEPENVLDSREPDQVVPYRMKTELDPLNERDFTYTDKLPDKTPDRFDDLIALQDKTDLAVRIAIAADRILLEREKERKERGLLFRYRYSFLARLIQSDESVQSFYGELKNYILSYQKVKCSAAWGHESFRYGRNTLIKIKIRGKAILLFFALSSSDYQEKKYRITDLSVGDKATALSVMLKVKSSRAVRNAKSLIDDVMKKFNVQKGETPHVDYSQKYMSTEELLNLPKPLVKAVSVRDEKDSDSDEDDS